MVRDAPHEPTTIADNATCSSLAPVWAASAWVSSSSASGIPFTIVERNHDVGGTWLENRFPGAGVDTPNLFYSWASRPNPHWSRYFSLRDELLAYLQDAATDLGIRDHIRFQTSLSERVLGPSANRRWSVSLESPSSGVEDDLRPVSHQHHRAYQRTKPHAVRRHGGLSGPVVPQRSVARGPRPRPARRSQWWEPAPPPCRCAPPSSTMSSQLTIYQRSPQWARPTPEYQRTVSSPATQWLFENVPFYSRWYRFTLFWRYGDGLLRFLRKDPDWPHPERSLNRVNDRHRQQMTDHITDTLAGRPALIEKCVPSYPPYGKRILLDNGWFDMLLREDVELVTDAVSTIDANGITDADGAHRVHDVIILATGFSIAKLAARLDIRGLKETLAEAWSGDNPTAHLGMTVPSFPNLFIGYGPNTNYGHGGSAFFNAECQTRYITETIVEMLEKDIATVDVKQVAHDEWIDRVDRAHAELVWTHPGLTTWYRNKHRRVVSTSPFRLVDYWAETHQTDLHNYHQTHR